MSSPPKSKTGHAYISGKSCLSFNTTAFVLNFCGCFIPMSFKIASPLTCIRLKKATSVPRLPGSFSVNIQVD